MEDTKDELMYEVLINRYHLGYLATKRELALQLHDLGYFNDETGQATEVTQKYFDDLYEKYKEPLSKEIRILKRNNDKITYNQLSAKMGFQENTFYLHHFLLKMNREGLIFYQELENFESELRLFLNKL